MNYEEKLPENYEEVFKIDAKDKKIGIYLTLGSFAIFIPVLLILMYFLDFESFVEQFNLAEFYLIFIFGVLAYMVLHELTHGFAYKKLTGHKLTFGISWSCAYCGVPDIYVYRKTALISLLAPLTVFTIILLPLTLYFYYTNQLLLYGAVGMIFATHLSGCIGDMYDTYLLLTKFKNPKLLMRDTGPAQWFYLPKE